MTSIQLIFLQLFLFFCLTSCIAYHHNPQRLSKSQIHRRRYSDNSTQHFNSTNLIVKQVKITLYYETLCPASVYYVTDILRPVVEKLGSYLDVHLVPYGHAQTLITKKRYKFRCQHGQPECYGNRVHACAIDVIRNNTKSVLFNACLMENTKFKDGYGYDYTYSIRLCGNQLNVTSNGIWPCVNTRRGVLLQKRYGDETHRLPRLDYVPYVLIDDAEEVENGYLIPAICRTLNPVPVECPSLYRKHATTAVSETTR